MMKLIFGLFFLASCPVSLSGQTAESKGPFLSSYGMVIAHFPDLHTGGHYTYPHRTIKESPFYKDNGFEEGDLIISGFEFRGLPLQYDVWGDFLVTITPIHRQMITLNPLKITRFILSDGSVFVKKENAPSYFNHKNGFYRQVINDKISLYCKHWKEFNKKAAVAFQTDDRYTDRQRYFLEIGGELIPVDKRKDAFEQLGLRKKALNDFLNGEKVKYKKNPERYLSIMVELANQDRKSVV